MTAKSVLLRP